jgi:hypothetical protein
MQQVTGPSTTAGAFVPLSARGSRLSVRPGCLSAFAGPVLALGLWLIGVAILVRPEGGSSHLLILAGGGLAATGLFVLLMRMSRTVDYVVPVPELSIGQGASLTPGALVPLRVRLQGPAHLARLKVTLVCERRYSEQTMPPGATAPSTVDQIETLSTQDFLDEADITIARGACLEREPTLAVPYLGRRSGPALPSGVIAWYLDVLVETAVGKPVHDQYDLVVSLSDSPETAPQPEGTGAGQAGRRDSTIVDLIPPSVGCAVIPLGFLFCGTVFLWLFFSGATTTRGNPVVGLIGGIVFSLLGILGLIGLAGGRGKKPRRFGRNDPRRLP